MSLDDLRKKIDDTDEKIVRLIAERIRISADIGKEKKRLNSPITDGSREKNVLEHVSNVAKEEKISPEDVKDVYLRLFAASKNVQGAVVAFQGEAGAYSEEAAFQYFGASIQAKPCESMDDVFSAVEKGQASAGIIPIENSLEGSINRCYDLLLDTPLKVSGETQLRVVHCLIANPGTKLENIKKVYSHPQALGQCQTFLRHLKVEAVPAYDTAGSVKIIKEQGLKDCAAIASARAAEIYGMEILARSIEDNQNNTTRFLILGKAEAEPTGNDKTSIVFSVRHKPGSLYDFLQVLAKKKINLTKIESRPTRQKPWEYNFYLDFEGHKEDKAVKETIAELEQSAIFLKVLGSYPRVKN